MAVKLSHPLKALAPMVVTPSGIAMLFKAVLPAKASAAIAVTTPL